MRPSKMGKRAAPPLAWPRWPVESSSGPSEALTPYERIGKVLDDAAKLVRAKKHFSLLHLVNGGPKEQ